jgi:precorrin-8X/cobalt-precorrin-8 methylmutase
MDIINDPTAIEKRSFEIITQLLGDKPLGANAPIIKRVIHTTADFDFFDNLVFTENVLERTISVLKRGGFHIVTDTRMAEAGINKRSLAAFGGSIHCFIDSPEVIEKAKVTNTTRSAVAVEHAVKTIDGPLIFVVGNAPTALLKICEVIEQKRCQPELVVGVPVGFVNVVESKDKILALDVPSIVAKGRKGGSNVAAAVVNAILYEAEKRGRS